MRRLPFLALPILAAIAAVLFVIRDPHGETAEAGGCAQSFAVFGEALSGHWEGTWENHTFLSNGTLSLDTAS